MPPNTTPTDPATADAGVAEPRSAAEHCAAAEALFACARVMYPKLSHYAVDLDEYQRCFDWARMHLRLAEAITAGAGLVLAHRQLLANDVRLHDTHVSSETHEWAEFLEAQHANTRRSA
ncbi:hypothetical protein [Amycolatopsis sp. cmx-11-32]|uniref:hypothetical protein n=1 Tax=Amycolatopsis sp. cmx-11-32 TaxID=2785796 RepID=UPI0039E60A4A